MGKYLNAGVAALFAIMATCTSAQAQWEAKCTPDRMTDKPHCAMLLTIIGPDRLAGYIIVGYEAGHLFASSRRPSQARLRIDNNPVVVSTDCSADVCFFDKQKTLLLNQMRSGSRLMVEVTNYNGVLGPLEASLSGFDEALRQMK